MMRDMRGIAENGVRRGGGCRASLLSVQCNGYPRTDGPLDQIHNLVRRLVEDLYAINS